jgi:hypothetical protein
MSSHTFDFTFLPLGEDQPFEACGIKLAITLLYIFIITSREMLIATQALVSLFVNILIRNEKWITKAWKLYNMN